MLAFSVDAAASMAVAKRAPRPPPVGLLDDMRPYTKVARSQSPLYLLIKGIRERLAQQRRKEAWRNVIHRSVGIHFARQPAWKQRSPGEPDGETPPGSFAPVWPSSPFEVPTQQSPLRTSCS